MPTETEMMLLEWADAPLAALHQKGLMPWELVVALPQWLPELITHTGAHSKAELVKRYPGVQWGADLFAWIAPTASIAPGATLGGCLWVGPEAHVGPGALLRGGVFLGAGASVGHGSEAKASILAAGAKAAHRNYVGNSLLGERVNLGAGTSLANLRLDQHEVVAHTPYGRWPTGQRKYGSILGAGAQVGCQVVIQPGTLVGPGALIGPCCWVRGLIPPHACWLARASEGGPAMGGR